MYAAAQQLCILQTTNSKYLEYYRREVMLKYMLYMYNLRSLLSCVEVRTKFLCGERFQRLFSQHRVSSTVIIAWQWDRL